MEFAKLAVIFDFDDTLLPDSTTQLLKAHGIEPDHFWLTDAKALIESGYDPALAFLKLMLDEMSPTGRLKGLTNQDLRAFGKTLDDKFYPGLPELFEDLRATVQGYPAMGIEFFIISGGLREIIEGTEFFYKNRFTAAYGCELAGDTNGGPLKHIKRCITFTEKTRYLFEISKGLAQADTARNPHLVNDVIDDRPIPISNMIYVGDGLTDIPCFSVVKKGHGAPFGVFHPGEKKDSARQALMKLLIPGRTVGCNTPGYRSTDALGALLRASVAARCAAIALERDYVRRFSSAA